MMQYNRKQYNLIIMSIVINGILASCTGMQIQSTVNSYPSTPSIHEDGPTNIEIPTSKIEITPPKTPSASPIITSTSSRFYRLIYQRGAGIYGMTVDQYGNTYPEEIFIDAGDTNGYIAGFDIGPDGKKILYVIGVGAGGTYDLLNIYDIDTQEKIPVGDNNTFIDSPKWSPSGEYVAYIYHQAESSIRIEPTMNCRNSCHTRYIRISQNETYGMLKDSDWLDNEHIEFILDRGGENNYCIADINNSGYSCLTQGGWTSEAALSPDQETLLITVHEDNKNRIYYFDYLRYRENEISEILPIKSSSSSWYSIHWSSDGQHIYYIKSEMSKKSLIYAEWNTSLLSIENEIILFQDDKLGGGITITKDGKMAAGIYVESSGPDYLCIFPIEMSNNTDKINCLENVASIAPQWIP